MHVVADFAGRAIRAAFKFVWLVLATIVRHIWRGAVNMAAARYQGSPVASQCAAAAQIFLFGIVIPLMALAAAVNPAAPGAIAQPGLLFMTCLGWLAVVLMFGCQEPKE